MFAVSQAKDPQKNKLSKGIVTILQLLGALIGLVGTSVVGFGSTFHNDVTIIAGAWVAVVGTIVVFLATVFDCVIFLGESNGPKH